MNNPTPSGSQPSTGHVIGGGRYSLHVPLTGDDLLWLAQDETAQRLVAIRFFPPGLRNDARAFDTLKRRLTAALRIKQPNVARPLEWYEAQGVQPFLAAEYVEGATVAEALGEPGRAGVSWEALRPHAVQVAAALKALHETAIVHHGVCPENLVVTGDTTRLLNVVTTGVVCNPLFVPEALSHPHELRCFSPQQIEGTEPSPADDVYAFGATLFELLTGTPVFRDATTLLADIRSTPAPSLADRLHEVQREAGVPADVVAFIMSCLGKDAAQRPKSFDALLPKPAPVPVAVPAMPLVVMDGGEGDTALCHAEAARVKATRDRARGRSVLPWAIAACLAACAAVAGGAWYVKQSRAEQDRLALVQAQANQAAQEAQDLKRTAAEQQKLAAQAEEKRRAEAAARERAETELKVKQAEAARMVADEERRRAEAEARARLAEAAIIKKDEKPAVPEPKRLTNPLPFSTTPEGFVSIFNGRDLTDWEGEKAYWSVMEGAITAQAPSTTTPRKRHYLVWKKGNVDEFELQFSYRFRYVRGNKQPNGGVLYRAHTNSTPELSSYQFDLATVAKDNGAVVDDKKRYRVIGNGDSGIARTSEKFAEIVETVGDTNVLAKVKAEDWNKCVIVARGNHFTHYINGVVVADLIDENKSRFHSSGLLALELHAKNTNNPATFVQYRDIKLKRLTKESGLASAKP
jgi:hypothetical protein